MNAMQSTKSSARLIVDGHYGFGFLINRLGKIVASNADAREFTLNAETLAGLHFDAPGYSRILDWIADDAPINKFLFTYVYFPGAKNRTCLFISSVDLLTGTSNMIEIFYLITLVDFEISEAVYGSIQETFDLTCAEADIAMYLAKGQTPIEIAVERKTSINTVRTQIKNILFKSNTHSISELVRILSNMSSKYLAVESQLARAGSSQRF